MATEQKKILMRRGNKADLALTDLQPGEIVLALDTNEVGIKTSGGVVLWFATLSLGPNAAVLQTEKGAASGIPTLNSGSKVVQDPASYGVANGGATLNAQGKVVQDPATAYLPLPIMDDNSTNKHYAKFDNGLLIEWGIVNATITLTTTYGSPSTIYFNNDYVTLINNFIGDVSGNVQIRSSGVIDARCSYYDSSTNQLKFELTSSVAVSNFSVKEIYFAIGRWK